MQLLVLAGMAEREKKKQQKLASLVWVWRGIAEGASQPVVSSHRSQGDGKNWRLGARVARGHPYQHRIWVRSSHQNIYIWGSGRDFQNNSHWKTHGNGCVSINLYWFSWCSIARFLVEKLFLHQTVPADLAASCRDTSVYILLCLTQWMTSMWWIVQSELGVICAASDLGMAKPSPFLTLFGNFAVLFNNTAPCCATAVCAALMLREKHHKSTLACGAAALPFSPSPSVILSQESTCETFKMLQAANAAADHHG